MPGMTPVMPGMPVVPGMPLVPGTPALPALPPLPPLSLVPALSALPPLPPLPAFPALPSFPAVPAVPVVLARPVVPAMSAMPAVPLFLFVCWGLGGKPGVGVVPRDLHRQHQRRRRWSPLRPFVARPSLLRLPYRSSPATERLRSTLAAGEPRRAARRRSSTIGGPACAFFFSWPPEAACLPVAWRCLGGRCRAGRSFDDPRLRTRPRRPRGGTRLARCSRDERPIAWTTSVVPAAG